MNYIHKYHATNIYIYTSKLNMKTKRKQKENKKRMATPTELSKELDHGLQFIFYQRINTYYELYLILQVPRNIYYNSKLHKINKK